MTILSSGGNYYLLKGSNSIWGLLQCKLEETGREIIKESKIHSVIGTPY